MQVADRAMRVLTPLLAQDSTIRVVDTLGNDRLVSPGDLDAVLHLPATAADSRARVDALIASADIPTVLLGDAANVPAGVVRIAPEGVVRNVGIVRAAVAEGQCLLEIRNDSDMVDAELELAGPTHRLQLPPRGQTRQYTLPVSGSDVHAHLNVADDLADDNDWWLLDAARPRLLASAGVPQPIRRFAAAYAAARKGSGTTVRIVRAGEPAEAPSIIVAPANHPVALPSVYADHPLLRNVRFPGRAMAASLPLPDGTWQVLLASGDTTLLAVDAQQQRVWVGLELPEESPEAVVLWTNLVEFVGMPREEQQTRPQRLDPTWRRAGEALPAEINGLRAGVYERDGEKTVVCVAAPAIDASTPGPAAEQRLREWAEKESRWPIAPLLWCLAGALAASAALVTVGASQAARRGEQGLLNRVQ
jgi:hypothetical protein